MVNTTQSAAGYLKWQVIEAATGKVVRDSGPDWIHNLILNIGMDRVAADAWANCYTNAICGTGVRPTNKDSTTTNATLSGGTITADASFFVIGDVGAELKWDDGTRAVITGFSSGTQVSTASVASASGHFVKYNTQDTALQVETKRTSTYLAGAGNCGTTWVGNQAQMRRTYDFSIESGSISYTEIGFSWTASGLSTTFARVLLPAPVFVDVGQQLRVIYELRLTLNPGAIISRSAAVSGWTGTSGQEQIQLKHITEVLTSGAGGLPNPNEPSAFGPTGNHWAGFTSTNSAAPAAFGSCVDRDTGGFENTSNSRAAYVAGTFYVDATASWAVGNSNATLRSFGYGVSNGASSQRPSSTTSYVFVLDNPQVKDNAHTLTMTFRASWSRDLA